MKRLATSALLFAALATGGCVNPHTGQPDLAATAGLAALGGGATVLALNGLQRPSHHHHVYRPPPIYNNHHHHIYRPQPPVYAPAPSYNYHAPPRYMGPGFWGPGASGGHYVPHGRCTPYRGC